MDDVIALTARLVGIDSVNPGLVAGGAGEGEIAAVAAGWLAARGFQVRVLDADPERPSVIAIAPGTGGGRSVMLNGHLDTVSLTTYAGDGLEAEVRDGRLFGRGAYDMKSGLAALMVAADAAAHREHAGDIVVALVADEEDRSRGTEAVLNVVHTDSAIVIEPSGTDIVTAHRGFVWAEVTLYGRAAHGSRPDLGIDAIVRAGHYLAALAALGTDLAKGPRHPLLGTGSLHASTIAGGTEASSYPDRCTIVIERRTLPGEDASTTAQELRSLLAAIPGPLGRLPDSVTIIAHRSPFAALDDSRCVSALQAAVLEITGVPPVLRGEPFWTDCALLADAGIDTALFGVDGGGAHAESEWVTLDSLDVTARTLDIAISDLTK